MTDKLINVTCCYCEVNKGFNVGPDLGGKRVRKAYSSTQPCNQIRPSFSLGLVPLRSLNIDGNIMGL